VVIDKGPLEVQRGYNQTEFVLEGVFLKIAIERKLGVTEVLPFLFVKHGRRGKSTLPVSGSSSPLLQGCGETRRQGLTQSFIRTGSKSGRSRSTALTRPQRRSYSPRTIRGALVTDGKTRTSFSSHVFRTICRIPTPVPRSLYRKVHFGQRLPMVNGGKGL